MRYRLHSHRNALTILENEPEFINNWLEIQRVLDEITDEGLIDCYNSNYSTKNKSLSTALNQLIREGFQGFSWATESPIFQDVRYQGRRSDYWRLDMAKENISIEVAFNHSTVIAWNLLKPVLASELNHVQKAIQTKLGVVITATEGLRAAGNFDNSIGTYEKFLMHLEPMMNQLSVPLLIIGLEAPETFVVSEVIINERKFGEITMLEDVSQLTQLNFADIE